MNIPEKAAEIMAKFHQFTHGYRVCMLIDRGEANSNKGSRRWVSKLISASPARLQENIEKLLMQQEYLANPDIRLYMCVNARSLDRAVGHFQHRQLDINYADRYLAHPNTEKEKFYTRIQDSFCSSLMKPENRAESLFLIDWDFDIAPGLFPPEVVEIFRYKTPNGWHIITKPFNPLLLQVGTGDIIKKDALLLLNVWGPNE